jgi:glycosyltransferase involved in cell wall biosynthesis
MPVQAETGPEGVPRISVGIPTIGRPHFLREAIASLAAQSWQDFEIVVADNSADAESHRLVDQVLSEFPQLRFVLVRHPRQISAADNFNSTFEAAQGEFWVLLPDDDRLRSNFLQRSVEALIRHPECAFTFADHWIIDDQGALDRPRSLATSARFGRNLLREGALPHDRLFELVLKQSCCLQTSMFRRSVIASVRFVPGVAAIDHSMFFSLSTGSPSWHGYYVDERIMEYRIHAEQESSVTRRGDLLRSAIAALESVREVPAEHLHQFKAKLGRQYLALALLEAEQGASGSARAHAIQSVKASPTLRSVLGAALTVVAPRAIPSLRRWAARLRTPGS